MHIQTADEIFCRRLDDVHASACFLAREVPNLAAAAQNLELRRLLNLYLDVIRDNADRSECALGRAPARQDHRRQAPSAVMVEALFDTLDRIEEPALADVAIVMSSTEIGIYEAQRLRLLSELAGQLGRSEATGALREGGDSLAEISGALWSSVGGEASRAS